MNIHPVKSLGCCLLAVFMVVACGSSKKSDAGIDTYPDTPVDAPPDFILDTPTDSPADMDAETGEDADADGPGDPDVEPDGAEDGAGDEGAEDIADEDEVVVIPAGVLMAVLEDGAERISSLVANSGYATDVPVEAGDVLRIRGQVEMTNDYADPVRGNIRLLADGVAVGSSAAQNCIVSGGHHMPLWADAVVTAGGSAPMHVEAQYAAGRSGADPTVRIEPGYGHVVVEQYREFESVEAAAAAGGKVLAELALDRTADSATFGTGGAFVRTVVYALGIDTLEGDLVRLFGQATSQWTSAGLDMHGLGLFDGDTHLGPWSTENFPWAIQSVPLWADAVDGRAAGLRSYGVSMHGVLGIGGIVVAEAGQLAVMRFSPLSLPIAAGSLEWSGSSAMPGPSADGGIVCNSGWQTIFESPLVAETGDVLRVTGTLQLAYPSGFDLGISCVARTDLLDAGGAVVDSSPTAPKYITRDLEVLPLRNEIFTTVGSAGAASARIQLVCSREAASPTVTVVGGGTWLLIDRFSPLGP
jgi:hypothetical protein